MGATGSPRGVLSERIAVNRAQVVWRVMWRRSLSHEWRCSSARRDVGPSSSPKAAVRSCRPPAAPRGLVLGALIGIRELLLDCPWNRIIVAEFDAVGPFASR